ncbi:MAG: hypothetical protein Q8O22_06560 [Candidatus Omnitrophota bacterium]|nr:hypothetical protein [Candidatus Omnitrophota bacterium]
MDARIRGALKEGLIYYIVAMAALLAMANIPPAIRQFLGFIIIIIGGYAAYINYSLGRTARAIIMGCLVLFFIPSVTNPSPHAWKPFFLLTGIVFSIFFIMTIYKAIKRSVNK